MSEKKGSNKKKKQRQPYRQEWEYFMNILKGINQIKQTINLKLDQFSRPPDNLKSQTARQHPKHIQLQTSASYHQPTLPKHPATPKNHLTQTYKTCRYAYTDTSLTTSASVGQNQLIYTPRTHNNMETFIMTPVKKTTVNLLKPYNTEISHKTQGQINNLAAIKYKERQFQKLLKSIESYNSPQRNKSLPRQPANNDSKQTKKSVKVNNLIEDSIILKQSYRRPRVEKQDQRKQFVTVRAFSINHNCNKENTKTVQSKVKEMSVQKTLQQALLNVGNIQQKRRQKKQQRQKRTKNEIQTYYGRQIKKLQLQNMINVLSQQFEACMKLKAEADKEENKILSAKMRGICFQIHEMRTLKNKIQSD